MLKFISILLWLGGALANFQFYMALQISGETSLLFGIASQIIFTYLEHTGIRDKAHQKDLLFMSVVVFAAALDVIMTSTGIYAKAVNLPTHPLGGIIQSMGIEITNAFLIITSLVFGVVIALATEVIWHKS